MSAIWNLGGFLSLTGLAFGVLAALVFILGVLGVRLVPLFA